MKIAFEGSNVPSCLKPQPPGGVRINLPNLEILVCEPNLHAFTIEISTYPIALNLIKTRDFKMNLSPREENIIGINTNIIGTNTEGKGHENAPIKITFPSLNKLHNRDHQKWVN